MKKPLLNVVLALSLFSCVACADLVRSVRLPHATTAPCEPSDWVYSLPKGQFLLQASRKAVSPQDLTAASTALTAANKAVKETLATLGTARRQLATDIGGNAGAEVIAADRQTVKEIEEALSVDQRQVALAEIQLAVLTEGIGKGVETYTLTQQPVAPDPDARFVAGLEHSRFRDDTLKVTVSNGLLSSATTTSVDQSLASAVKLAEIGVSIASFVASGIPLIPPAPGSRGFDAAQARTELPVKVFPFACTYEISEIFDPLRGDDVRRVNDVLRKHHASIRTEVRAGEGSVGALDGFGSGSVNGLVYRVPTSVIVSIVPAEAELRWDGGGVAYDLAGSAASETVDCPMMARPAFQSVMAIVPDTRSAYVTPADAGPFTSTTLTYTFAAGMLTDYSVSRPSEVAAPVEALGQLVQEVVSLPSSILKLRFDFANSSAELVKAQSALASNQAEARLARVNAQTALADANAALIKAQFGDQQAWIEAQRSLISAQKSLDELLGASANRPSETSTGK